MNAKFKIIMLIFLFLCQGFLLMAGQPVGNFVLVHGAWHGPWCWFELKAELESNGHTITLVELPGHGIDFSDPYYITLADYQDAVTAVLDQSPGPVILVGHSMSGIVISQAAEARPLKVEKLVYLAAYCLSDGQSLLDIASQDAGSQIMPELLVNPIEGTVDIRREHVDPIFYNLCPAQYPDLAGPLLRASPMAPFLAPVALTPENYGSVERFYIFTTKDKVISYPAQQLMVAAQPCEAVFTLKAGHSPFFSNPKTLRKILEKIVQGKY